LLTNHTTPGHSIETEHLEITLRNVPEPREVHIQLIDEGHANPKLLWEEMGQPEYLTQKEIDQLLEASLLVKKNQRFKYEAGALFLKTNLPPHAVAAITVAFAQKEDKKS
jgi:xylan 1,4-beta-xylosidase